MKKATLIIPILCAGVVTASAQDITTSSLVVEFLSDSGGGSKSPIAVASSDETSSVTTPVTVGDNSGDPKTSPSISLQLSTSTAPKQDDGNDRLLSVLGPDVYYIPVNITTPANTPVEDVIRILAERAQLNFVVADGVIKGNISLRMRDVPLGTVLNSLLSSNDLFLLKDGPNVLRIVPRDSVQGGGTTYETRTMSRTLNWVPGENIKQTVSQISKTANVQVDKSSNTIFVTDASATIDGLMDIITQLDIPPRQVQVDSYVVEVVNEDTLKKNANISIQSKNGMLNGSVSDSVPYTSPERFFDVVAGVGTFSGGSVVNIFGSQYDIRGTLQWAEDQRIAKILANPSIVTLDNEKATIDIVTQVPYVEAQQGVGGSGTTSNAVQFKDTGIKLEVTPQITNNGYVRLNIAPEQMVKTGDFQNDGSPVPIIATRKAATTVVVKDKDTVVIGGLSQIQNDRSDSGVPWLRKAPIFGRFFADTSKSFTKNNLVVFVTPQIVKATGLPVSSSNPGKNIRENMDLPDFNFDDSLLNRVQGAY